jgi:hypothetical protein
MRKAFWVLILLILFLACAWLYKLNLEKEQAIGEGENETNFIWDLDEFETKYLWIFGGLVVVVISFIIFSVIREKAYA